MRISFWVSGTGIAALVCRLASDNCRFVPLNRPNGSCSIADESYPQEEVTYGISSKVAITARGAEELQQETTQVAWVPLPLSRISATTTGSRF
jgi:hypothetical protein